MKTKWCSLGILFVLPALAFAQRDNGQRNGDPIGWIGVAFVMESDKNRVVITDMQPNGPAAQSNLKVGDVIVRVGKKEPKTAQEFADEIAWQNPGDKVSLLLMREGKGTMIEVTIGRRPNGMPRQ